MIWKNKKRELVAVRIILIIALVFALISVIKDPNLTGFTASENRSNSIPVWKGNTTWQIDKNNELIVDLDDYFKDPDYDTLTYLATSADKVSVSVENNILTITPDNGFAGERVISILASDEYDAITVNVKLVIGTEEQRALRPVNESNITTSDIEVNETLSSEINISENNHTIELNVTLPVESNISALETDNTSVKRFRVEEKIEDENKKHVGKKVKDELEYETLFNSIIKNETGLTVVFHHNASVALPVWVEGDINYSLSAEIAEPYENITLFVPRVKGIIPKFKLHVGITSDVFEFGKTVPDVLFTGSSELIDRDDEKIDINLVKNSSKAEIRGVVDVSAVTAKTASIDDTVIKTDIFAAENISMDNATIILPKSSDVNVILECLDYNLVADSCTAGWTKTSIPFEQNKTHIKFTVSHFSAYGGGIYVTRAQHLSSNYSFIADVYNEVKDQDNVWTHRINNSQYVRADFHKNITSNKVMDIFARGNGTIEVYNAEDSSLVVSSGLITSPQMVYLSMENLSSPDDTFDLKTSGEYLEYDFIHDATAVSCGATLNSSEEYILSADTTTSGTCFTLDGDNITLDCQGFSIHGDQSGTDYAVKSLVNGQGNNFTMLNCLVYNFSYPLYYYFDDSYFFNNTFTSQLNYIYMNGARNNWTSNTIQNQRSSSSRGIWINGDNHLLKNNYFFNNSGDDIYISSAGNRFINNTIDMNAQNSSGFFYSSSGSAIFENNTVQNVGTGNDVWAYELNNEDRPLTFRGNNNVDGENVTEYFYYNQDNLIFDKISRGKEHVLDLGQLVLYDCQGIIINNSLFENHSDYYMQWHDVENITVVNNSFNYVTDATTRSIDGDTIHNLTFENNTVRSDGTFLINGIEDGVFRNNTFYTVGDDCLSLTAKNANSDVLIEENFFDS
ncbi:hypothetical protein GF358_03375, partial [Candidatus Woesearchaeota archaeon]|nr:hypothetical protein [Candidatus Woesearchaeota archaeon]